MAFLKRISDSFWSYVSPTKTETTKNTPQTLPKFKKPAIPLRRGSIDDVLQRRRSMSPEERVGNWRVRSASQASSSVAASNKRKRPITPSTGKRRGRPRKLLKMEDADMDYTPEVGYESDIIMEDGEEVEDEMAEEDSSDESNINVGKSPSPSPSPRRHPYPYDSSEIDSSLVVSESEYQRTTPKRKLIVSPTEEHFSRGVSTEELRAQGWDDDHIVLVQKIAMRGYEPLMPQYWRFEYRFHMPDSLFVEEKDDGNAVISSVRGDHYRAIMALEKLFELGGRMRDRVYLKGRVRPEQQVRRTMNEYIKWAEEDSGLDRRTAIPLLALENKPVHVAAEVMKQNAKRKLARLAARYREAFRVLQSIENSPASRTSTQLSYPVPTLYAIIASHTLIALTAYNPEDAEPDVKIVAMFEMKDKDYDIWNALALAIVVCHVRNVQMRIAEETGLGLKSTRDAEGGMEEEEDDPDV